MLSRDVAAAGRDDPLGPKLYQDIVGELAAPVGTDTPEKINLVPLVIATVALTLIWVWLIFGGGGL